MGNISGDTFSIMNLKMRHPQIYWPSAGGNFVAFLVWSFICFCVLFLYLYSCVVFVSLCVFGVCVGVGRWSGIVFFLRCFVSGSVLFPVHQIPYPPGTDTFSWYTKYLFPGRSYKHE